MHRRRFSSPDYHPKLALHLCGKTKTKITSGVRGYIVDLTMEVQTEEEHRTKLRLRYLFVLRACIGREISDLVFDGGVRHTTAKLLGINGIQSDLAVSELETSLGTLPVALVRCSDVASFEVAWVPDHDQDGGPPSSRS
mmetsp:Transcript_11973/g.24383  ORF Transcript_11973/g.24383 Transcript_11973/m.24383 type:complete len:139 (-) Transcript_11973:743-1159(-)